MNKFLPVFCFVLLGLCAILFNQSNKLADDVLKHEQAIKNLNSTVNNMSNNLELAMQAASMILDGDIQSGSHQFSEEVAAYFGNIPYCMKNDQETRIHFAKADGTFSAWSIENHERTFDRTNKDKTDSQGRYKINRRYVLWDAVLLTNNQQIKGSLIINDVLPNGQIVEYHTGVNYFNNSTCPDFVKSQF